MSDLKFHTAPAVRADGRARPGAARIDFEISYAGGNAIYVHTHLDGAAPFIDGPALRDALIEKFPLPAPKDEPETLAEWEKELLGIAEPKPVTVPTATNGLRVGDKVRLKEATGDVTSRAKVGDLGVVEKIGGDGRFRTVVNDPDFVVVRMDDGSQTCRYARRFELAPKPIFKVGDRVKRVGPHNLDGSTRDRFGKDGEGHESRLGWLATVTRASLSGVGTIGVRWDETGSTSSIHASALEIVTAPEFKVGDLVKLTGPHTVAGRGPRTFHEAPKGEGSLARVIEFGTAPARASREGNVRVKWLGNGRTSLVAKTALSPATLDEAGDPVGSIVYVTGDTGDTGHGYEVGTEVRVVKDFDEDGDYRVARLDERYGDYEYVNLADLSIEKPAPVFKVGDRVEVRRESAGLLVNTRAKVVEVLGGLVKVTDDGTNNPSHRFTGEKRVDAHNLKAYTGPCNRDQGYLLKVGDRVAGYAKKGVLVSAKGRGGYGTRGGDCEVVWYEGAPAWEGTRPLTAFLSDLKKID